MIAADSSSWIAYIQGEQAPDTVQLRYALQGRQVQMVPVVLAELLSGIAQAVEVRSLILGVPLLDLLPDFWHRTGDLRAKVIRRGRRAWLPDALIAQTCIDHQIPLLTRDRDFQIFQDFGLRLQPTAAG